MSSSMHGEFKVETAQQRGCTQCGLARRATPCSGESPSRSRDSFASSRSNGAQTILASRNVPKRLASVRAKAGSSCLSTSKHVQARPRDMHGGACGDDEDESTRLQARKKERRGLLPDRRRRRLEKAATAESKP